MGSLLTVVGDSVLFIGFLQVVSVFVIAGIPVLITVVSSVKKAMASHEASSQETEDSDGDEDVLPSKKERIGDKQLVAVPCDHWLFRVVCQAKRLEHTQALQRLEHAQPVHAAPKLKAKYLSALLPDLKHELLRDHALTEMSERVVSLASIFSELLPEYEPLLVEVALVHCLHEWTASRDDRGVDDAEVFEAFLMAALQSDQAQTWFGCQFVIDTIDVLVLSRLFYKERLIVAQNKRLRDLISISIVESCGDSDEFSRELQHRLALKQNKAAADAWTAWVGEEIATVGSAGRCRKASTSLAVLSDLVINPTYFVPDKRVYFPFAIGFKGISANSFGDLSGIINRSKGDCDDYEMERGFIYEGGELLAVEAMHRRH